MKNLKDKLFITFGLTTSLLFSSACSDISSYFMHEERQIPVQPKVEEKKPERKFFVCKYWKDNSYKTVDLKFLNKRCKTEFTTNEIIVFVGYNLHLGKVGTLKTILHQNRGFSSYKETSYAGGKYSKSEEIKTVNLPTGTYNVDWFFSNEKEPIGSTEFTIKPSRSLR